MNNRNQDGDNNAIDGGRPEGVQDTERKAINKADACDADDLVITDLLEEDSIDWHEENPPAPQLEAACKKLMERTDGLFRTPDARLLRVDPNGSIVPIDSNHALRGYMQKHIEIRRYKKGDLKGYSLPSDQLNMLLHSPECQTSFPIVDKVLDVPSYTSDFKLIQPGYNPGPEGERCYLTRMEPVVSVRDQKLTRALLDTVAFKTQADATNAVGFALTVLLRPRFAGAKPFVIVTANRSHAGKDTVVDYACGMTRKTEVSYQEPDWPVQKEIVTVLRDQGVGVVHLSNVRAKGGGTNLVKSPFIERLVMDDSPLLQTSRASDGGSRRDADFIISCSLNGGVFNEDLLNRSLPIELELKGDLKDRPMPLGNLRYEWLPAHRSMLEAELFGMVENWIDAGCPLDTSQRHPMKGWAQTVGGILMVNGFKGFLANWPPKMVDAETSAVAKLAHLAFVNEAFSTDRKGTWRVDKLVELAEREGMLDVLMSGQRQKIKSGREAAMGRLLSRFESQTLVFDVRSEEVVSPEDLKNPEKQYVIRKTRKRLSDNRVCTCYTFEQR